MDNKKETKIFLNAGTQSTALIPRIDAIKRFCIGSFRRHYLEI